MAMAACSENSSMSSYCFLVNGIPGRFSKVMTPSRPSEDRRGTQMMELGSSSGVPGTVMARGSRSALTTSCPFPVCATSPVMPSPTLSTGTSLISSSVMCAIASSRSREGSSWKM